MKKIIVFLICISLLLSGVSGSNIVKAANYTYSDTMTYGYYTYVIRSSYSYGDEILIKGYSGNEKIVEIPNEINGISVDYISNNVFENNSVMEKLILPSSIGGANGNGIGEHAFRNCTSLKEVIMGFSSIYAMNFDTAFMGCENLEKYEFSTEITSRDKEDVPYGYYTLDGVIYRCYTSNWVTHYSLCYCPPAKGNFDIPDYIDNIGMDAFRYNNKITSVTIPKEVSSVGMCAFSSCKRLKSIDFSESSVKKISYGICDGCKELTSVKLSEKTEMIDDWAFSETRINSINILDNVGYISEVAFSKCDALNDIRVSAGNQYYVVIDNVLYCKKDNGWDGLHDCLHSYDLPNNNSLVLVRAASDITQYTGLESYSVCGAPGETFAGCKKLRYVCIPKNFGYGDYRMFEDCSMLEGFYMDSEAKMPCLYYEMFKNCKKLETVEISDSVTYIEDCFEGCNSLKKIIIPESVTRIDENVII